MDTVFRPPMKMERKNDGNNKSPPSFLLPVDEGGEQIRSLTVFEPFVAAAAVCVHFLACASMSALICCRTSRSVQTRRGADQTALAEHKRKTKAVLNTCHRPRRKRQHVMELFSL